MFNRNLGPDIRFANIENNQIDLGEPNLKVREPHRRKSNPILRKTKLAWESQT